jgi:hypothetical protein
MGSNEGENWIKEESFINQWHRRICRETFSKDDHYKISNQFKNHVVIYLLDCDYNLYSSVIIIGSATVGDQDAKF